MQRNQTEDQAQRITIAWLRAHGWTPCNSLNGTRLSGSKLDRIKQWAKLVTMGALKGAADFHMVEMSPANGRPVSVEMKRAKGDRAGVVSKEQKAVHAALLAAGWNVIVAHGSDDAIEQLTALGFNQRNPNPMERIR